MSSLTLLDFMDCFGAKKQWRRSREINLHGMLAVLRKAFA
jgi:hypothetical protein